MSEAASDEADRAQTSQQQGISLRTRTRLQNVIVARDFPLQRHLSGNPPDARMKGKRSENEMLKKVGPIITSAHMSQFVA